MALSAEPPLAIGDEVVTKFSGYLTRHWITAVRTAKGGRREVQVKPPVRRATSYCWLDSVWFKRRSP